MLRLLLTTLLASVLVAPSAQAAVKASAALVRSGEVVRLQVTVTSAKAFTASTRPRSVKVGKFALKRESAARKRVVFGSGALAAADAAKLSGATASIRVRTKRGTKTLRAKVAPAPAAPTPPAPGPTAPAPGAATPSPGTPPAPNATRDDAAGRAVLAGGDLLLEWYSFGSSGMTAEYRRIWFMGDGRFQLNVKDWNTVSGEICRTAIPGTWTFKEGWTSTEKGGLVLVKVAITTAQGTGDEVLTFANADPNAVYIGGASPVRFERNPQIRQDC